MLREVIIVYQQCEIHSKTKKEITRLTIDDKICSPPGHSTLSSLRTFNFSFATMMQPDISSKVLFSTVTGRLERIQNATKLPTKVAILRGFFESFETLQAGFIASNADCVIMPSKKKIPHDERKTLFDISVFQHLSRAAANSSIKRP